MQANGRVSSFDINYAKDTLSEFTSEEIVTLRELHKQLDDKYAEIVGLLSKTLGYATDDPRLDEEADDAIENWDDAFLDDVEGALEATHPLQILLRDHHEIAERIMDIRDDSISREMDD
jgi:hypothetical protein